MPGAAPASPTRTRPWPPATPPRCCGSRGRRWPTCSPPARSSSRRPSISSSPGRAAEPDVVEPLRRLHEESTASRHDPQRYASLAARFHEQVIELAGNRTLTLIGLILLEIVEPHNRATFAAIDRGEEIVEHAQDDHATLIDMIERGDDGASAYWRQHMRGATLAAFEALGADATISVVEPAL